MQSSAPRVLGRAVAPQRLDGHARLDGRLRQRRELRELVGGGRTKLDQTGARNGLGISIAVVRSPEELLLLVERGEVALEHGETLGRSRDVGVGGLDLLIEEADLLRGLGECAGARASTRARAGEVVGDHLALGAELAARASTSFGVWMTAGPTSVPSGATNDARGCGSCFAAASSIESAR